ncbi:MAG: NTP transferase domain-containing protein [Deltaproteobacteria bacterium]
MIPNITAVIPAAGYASRMGRIKPLLPLGKGTVIEFIVGSLHAAGVTGVIVVLGHRYKEIILELKTNNVAWVVNEQYAQGMMSSFKKGIEALGDGTQAFFILPADIPLVRPSTLKDLVNTHKAHPGQILYPTFQGQRGHPPLIPTYFREKILSYEGPGGLRRCLKAWDRDVLEVATSDQGILMDMDTPDDYETILQRSKILDIPSKQEALALLKIHQQDNPKGMEHATTVASLAVAVGIALKRAGNNVNVQLIDAAGILHDIAKGRPGHAQRGADLVTAKGFPAVADVVGKHMDLAVDPEGRISEQEVVFLADKMVRGASTVSLEKRLYWKKEQFAGDPEALKMATSRMEQAISIKKSVEKIIGKSLEKLVSEIE